MAILKIFYVLAISFPFFLFLFLFLFFQKEEKVGEDWREREESVRAAPGLASTLAWDMRFFLLDVILLYS